MSRRTADYKARDPVVTERDPKPEDLRNIRIAVPCVPEGNTVCPKCGHNVSRIETTRKYDETEPVMIIRYRSCRKCGARFASRKVVG